MFYLFLLLIFIYIAPEGFSDTVLVRGVNGYRQIGLISVGSKVYSQDIKDKKQKIKKVEAKFFARIPYYVECLFRNESFCCAPNQQFYFPCLKKWVTSEKIAADDFYFKKFQELYGLISARIIYKPIDVYILSTKKYHNYFVTKQNILTHNFCTTEFSAFANGALSYGATQLVFNTVQTAGSTLATGGIGLVVGIGLYFLSKYIFSTKESNRIQKYFDKDRQNQLQNEFACKQKNRVKIDQKENDVFIPNFPGGPQKKPDDDSENNSFFDDLKKRSNKHVRTNRFGKIYEDPETGFWWSKDLARHGASRFKVFKKTNKGFSWIFNADKFGNKIINQNKGPIGSFISKKDVIYKI